MQNQTCTGCGGIHSLNEHNLCKSCQCEAFQFSGNVICAQLMLTRLIHTMAKEFSLSRSEALEVANVAIMAINKDFGGANNG